MKRAGVTTGSFPSDKNTSHSALEISKKALLGLKQFHGGEEFMHFGNAVHERCLLDKAAIKLPKDKERLAKAMGQAFYGHRLVRYLMDSPKVICERKAHVRLNGVKMAVILDIDRPDIRTGADLKTTNARSEKEFIEKAKEFGYFRQAITYIRANNLKKFYFIAVTKNHNPKIYVLDVHDYPEELAYAEKELAFLLYFFKHYGKFVL